MTATSDAESWLPIPGWENFYAVSSLGRVRSEERTVIRANGIPMRVRERILAHKFRRGTVTPVVTLCRANTAWQVPVPVLVAMVFGGGE